MFTGIVETMGHVQDLVPGHDSARITVNAPDILADTVHGASISVNGVCLTVVDFTPTWFSADIMQETLTRSTLGDLSAGDPVNLERAMPVHGRLGGHIVQGHVDSQGIISSIRVEPEWTTVTVSVPPSLSRFIVEKGSITINGVSLTVVWVSDPQDADQQFGVSLIPTTLAATTLGGLQVGDHVNLEVDAIAKYVQRLMAFSELEKS